MVGEDPNAIFYDHKTKRIFTIDRGSKSVTALDPRTGRVVGAVNDLKGRTEHSVSDDAGHLFLNIQDLGLLYRIDSQSLQITDTWPLAPCGQPSSMDMDRITHRIFIGCRSGAMTVVDAITGRIVAMQPIGGGVDATEYDEKRGLIYFSTGADGMMSVFHQDNPEKYSLVERVKTQVNSRTMAVDRTSGRAYLPAAEFGPIPPAEPGKKQLLRGPMVPGSFSLLVIGQ
jgi:DNA-binding beta-propeller fold protein YncE